MRQQLAIPCILIILFFTGCISKNIQDAASKAGQVIKSKETKISKGVFVSTEKEEYKSYDLEFAITDTDIVNYSPEKLMSISAYIFVSNLEKTDIDTYQKIEVKINMPDTKYEAVYDIEKLVRLKEYINTINVFLNAVKTKDVATYEKLIPIERFDKDVQWGIYNAFMIEDSINGEFQSINVTGFRFSNKNENDRFETTIWCDLLRKNDITKTTFRFGDKKRNIVFVGVNYDR